MGRQRVVVGLFGAAVVAAVGVALFLVLGQPPQGGTAPDEQVTEPGEQSAATEEAPAPEKRRHAGQAGNASVVGRLVRGKDSVPVTGETVRLDREGLPGWGVVSGEDGTFRFERLPHGGPFTLSAVVADCAPVSLPGLALDRREELDVGDVRLDRAVSVTIQVRSLDDTPIEGALVEAFAQATVDWSGDWTKRLAQVGVTPVAVTSLRTDAAGEARFESLATGTWGFRASAAGHARRGRGSVKLTPEDDEGRKPIVIRLWPGHGLSGRVLDDDDAPIAGALVLGMKPNQAWSPQSAPLYFRSTTDEEGRYALDAVPSGELAVWAAPPGGIPAQVAVLTVPDLDTFDVHLRLGGVLRGQVTEQESGEPIPDIEVRATGWATNSQRVGVAVTDAEGRYVIDTMLEGIVNQVTVDRPGWLVVHERGTPWQQIALQHGTETVHDLVMRKGAVATGVVRGPDGPLAGAGITLYASEAGRGWTTRTAKTDASGRYRIEGLDTGPALIQVSAPGHAQPGFPANYWEAMNNRALPPEWALDVPSEGEVVKDVELVRGGVATGVVKGPDDEPVAGASVSAWGGNRSVSAKTDAEGAFSLEGLPLDVQLTVRASAEGMVSSSEQLQAGQGAPVEGLLLLLRQRPTLRGTVTPAEGELPPGVAVRISQPHSFDSGNPWNWQDPERRWDGMEPVPVRADGTYETTLPFDSGKLVVRASADGAPAVESDPIELTEGRLEYQVDLRLGPGLPLLGRVEDGTTGAPVAGALVAVGSKHPLADQQPWVTQNVHPPLRAVTDAEGRFRLQWPRKGKLDVRVTRNGYVEAKPTVALPQEGELTVKLQSALRIAGFVRSSDGSPVAGVQISYQIEGNQTYSVAQTIITGEDGAFEIRDLPAGSYTLTAQPPWNGALNIKHAMVRGVAAGTTDVEISVEAGLSITGRVLAPDGEGAASVWVNAQAETQQSGGGWRGASTRNDGSFDIVGLDEGTYTLHVSSSQGSQTTQVKGVAAGTQDVVVRLAEGMEIRGEVVDEQGEPVANVTLYATSASKETGGMVYGSNMAQTGSDGTFVLQGLAPGEYRILRTNNGQGDAATRNHVLVGGEQVAAGSTGVRLVLSKGAVISGTVTDAGGTPVTGANRLWVRARVVGGGGDKWVAVQADGTFEMAGLSPDVEYELRTMGGGFRPGSSGPTRGGTEGVRIVVEPGLTCTGRLVDRSGHGIGGVSITFRYPDTDDYTWAQTDDDGAFEASGLMEGEYNVTAWIQSEDEAGNRTGQQRQVELGQITAGTSSVTLEVPEE